MDKHSKILILGSTGLVGSAVVRKLKEYGYTNLLTPTRSKDNLDLTNKNSVAEYFRVNSPEYVFLCAAKVGGIIANSTYPVEFFQENISIGMNVLESSYKTKVKKLLNLGSTCIYPKSCKQPIKEEYLLTDLLEPTNEAYALAKIGILKLCEYYNREYKTNYITALPTNIYGLNDNYHPKNSHVFPAIIRKVIEAKSNNATHIELWGDGSPIREFIYSDDVADAMIFLMNNYDSSTGPVNIGTGKGMTIKQLYETIMKIIDYNVPLNLDLTKPNGTPIKISDVSKLNSLGFHAKTTLEEGVKVVYEDLKRNNFNWKER